LLKILESGGCGVKLQWRTRRRGQKSGATAVEFVFIAPIFLVLMFGIIEAGAVYIGESTLQFATSDVGRRVRTGEIRFDSVTQSGNTNQTEFRTLICQRTAAYLACDTNLIVDVRSYSDFTAAQINNPINEDNEVDGSLGLYDTGKPCDVVVVRALYKWTMHTPFITTFLVNLPPSQRLISAAFASRNEPFDSSVTGC
jgi:Flp pilus assembly protein TadG